MSAVQWTLVALLGTSTFGTMAVLATAVFALIGRLDQLRTEVLGRIGESRQSLRDDLVARIDASRDSLRDELGGRLDRLEQRFNEHLRHHAA